MELPRRSERLKRKREQQIVPEVKQKKLQVKKRKVEETVQLKKDITCLKKAPTKLHNRCNAQSSAQEEQKISLRIRLNNKLYKIDNLQLFRRRLQDIYSKKSYLKKRAFI